jgi:hypothetical protein
VKVANQTRRDAIDLDRARSQPYVVATFEPLAAAPHAMDLVIKNYGVTSATNVRFFCFPWPEKSGQYPGTAPTTVVVPQIPVLAPGQEWRVFWDDTRRRKKSDLPKRHVGSVEYLGIDEAQLRTRTVMDWTAYQDRTWIEMRTIHDVGVAMRDIRGLMNKFGKSAVKSDGLKVLAYDGEAVDIREDFEYQLEMHEAFPDRFPAPKPMQRPRRLVRPIIEPKSLARPRRK